MSPFFDLALAGVSTTSTLAAFAGNTTREGPEPLLQRINARGWLSLVCLFLTLFLGVTKVVQTTAEDKSKEAQIALEKAKDHAEAEARQAVLKQQLAEALGKADRAEKALADLNTIDTLTQDRVGEARSTLNDVHGTLKATRDYLDQSSASSLVATLANDGATVSDIMVVVPLTAKAHFSEQFRQALLPAFDNRECIDLTGLMVAFLTNVDSAESIYYTPGDEAKYHDYLDDPVKKKDAITALPSRNRQTLSTFDSFTGQHSTNGVLYTAIFHTAGHAIPAAQLYSTLAKPDAEVFAFETTWPTVFRTRTSLDQSVALYPQVYTGTGNVAHLMSGNDGWHSATSAPYPGRCSAQVKEYFARAFDKATLMILLEQNHNEMITVRLQAKPPRLQNGMWYVPFVATGAPVVQAFGDALTKANDLKWTADPPSTVK